MVGMQVFFWLPCFHPSVHDQSQRVPKEMQPALCSFAEKQVPVRQAFTLPSKYTKYLEINLHFCVIFAEH